MIKSKLTLLKEAVIGKKKITMKYAEDPSGSKERLIYPHAIYRDSEKQILLDAYQVEGYSKTKKFPRWKTFNVKGIKNPRVLNEDFKILKTFNPRSGKYKDLIVYSQDYPKD